MANFVFNPTEEQLHSSNIYKLMKKFNSSDIFDLSQKASNDPDSFWREVEREAGVVWSKPYSRVCDMSDGIAWARWFVDGKINYVDSSISKFSKLSPEKIAYYFISEDGIESKINYQQLESEVNRLANGLKSLGVKKGDVVAIYLPMIKEAIVSILAATKIGATNTVIFSGFSSDSLKVRLQDCSAKVLIACDGFTRRGKPVSQKKIVGDAIKDTKIETTIIVKYKSVDRFDFGIDYGTLTSNQSEQCKSEIMDSCDPLFILYTSGTTGRPKGVVHTYGGFTVFAAYQSAYLIDTQKDDVLFWPADIGWITGLVWNVYGLLMIGASAVIYDGALDYPNLNRAWDILFNYNVTIFGISPTAVRLFKKNNIRPLSLHPSYKIKNIPTTGEPIDEESWWWLFNEVGNGKIPIMNLSGGTEIGGAMLSVFPGMKLKPSTVGIPCPGMSLDVFDDSGRPVRNEKGYLVVKSSWPATPKGLLNDPKRYLETYWSRFDDVWFHGDYVMVDNDGLWYMHGRVDDVINVSGHRLSTTEIEQCVISHPKIVEAASVSIPDEITGEAIVVFAVEESKVSSSEISQYISQKIGKIAKPKHVFLLKELPKTRTGKIMRRVLRAKILGEDVGDLSSLENPKSLDGITRLA